MADQLKAKLVKAQVLAHPNFNEKLTLDTNTSVHGLGAILSQVQEDMKLHPLVYASGSLSDRKKGTYAITELETLAFVRAMRHFHSYYSVMVLTDHSAVKAILCNSEPEVLSMQDGGLEYLELEYGT